jgi:hypothetical protein
LVLDTRLSSTSFTRAHLLLLFGCGTLACSHARPAPPPPPAPPSPVAPAAEPTPTPAVPQDDPLAVQTAPEPLIVAAWPEPSHLPAGGGQTQILIRVQRRGGKPYPAVEVRLRSNKGSLYSAGRILVTDAMGLTRDRLTTHETATITLNAGGMRYRFVVPVGED